jgi:hypothetical protein
MTSLISHIELSIEKAENLESNITPEVLEIEGASDVKTRHFYNNLCSMDDVMYMEIGNRKEDSLCSVLSNNLVHMFVISDWGDEDIFNDEANFFKNIQKCKKENTNSTYVMIKKPIWWNIDEIFLNYFHYNNPEGRILEKYNIFTCGSDHTDSAKHKDGLVQYLNCLTTEFVYIVNNWNETEFRDDIINAIKDNNTLEILYQNELSNGLGIFVLKQVIPADDEF